MFEKTGRDDELAELLAKQIELASARGDASVELKFRVRLGEVQETRLGSAEKAIETYKAILERDAAHDGALLALARLHEARGERAEAASALERVLARAEGDEAVAFALRLADVFATLEDIPGQRRALERGLEARRSAAELRDRLRTVYEKQEAWSELADLTAEDARAAEDVAAKVRLLRTAAEIHQAKRSDPAAAAKLLAEASEDAPQDRDLLLALCDAYSASGRGKEAVDVLQKIVDSYGGRRSKDLAVIHHRIAKAHLADQEREKALAELDVAFKIDPGSVSVLRDLGVLALDLADVTTSDDKARDQYVDRASKTFLALLLQKLDATSPISKAEVFFYLGDVSRRQGDTKKATQMLERALDNDKNLERAKELLAQLKA
jgi:tetratricopeptide (TPR) repeat protein